MKLRSIILIALAIGWSSQATAQGIYFDPSPTDVTGPVRLYIDVSSSDCDCPELLDGDQETNPLYIWAWNPNEARPDLTIGGETYDTKNGDWGASNENLKLTQDDSDPNLWYFDFLGASMVQFYNVPAAQFYESGIDFLLKEKNGAPADLPEQKSPDLNIIPEPVGCFDKVCPFPTQFFQDDFFSITYNNNQETISSLQNLNEGEALIWFRYKVNGGAFEVLQDEVEGVMDYDGDGVFSVTMIPEDYFGLAESDILDEIQVYITKSPIVAPPFTTPISLFPGCGE